MEELPAFPDHPAEGNEYVPVPLERLELGKYYFVKRQFKDFLDDYHIVYAIVKITKRVEGMLQHQALGIWNDRDHQYYPPAADARAWALDGQVVVPDIREAGESIVFKVPADDAMEIGGRRRRRVKKTRKARKLKRKQTRRYRR